MLGCFYKNVFYVSCPKGQNEQLKKWSLCPKTNNYNFGHVHKLNRKIMINSRIKMNLYH